MLAVWSFVNGLDCRTCNKQLQDFRGCVKDLQRPFVFEGETYKRCPLRYVESRASVLIEFYLSYKKGFLPNTGGWLDQPVRFSKSMDVIEQYVNKLQEERKDGNGNSSKYYPETQG